MEERLLRGDGLEHERSRRDDFDPIAQGKQYGLDPTVSTAIGERALREATSHHGVCDESLARERFDQLAKRVAERVRQAAGRSSGPLDPGRCHIGRVPSGNVLADPVPGRTTQVLARASGRAGIALNPAPGRTTLIAGQVDSDLSRPDDSRGFFQSCVSGGHAARSMLERAIASRDHYAALVATTASKQDLTSARHYIANGLADGQGLRDDLVALEGPAEQLLARVPNMSAGGLAWERWGPGAGLRRMAHGDWHSDGDLRAFRWRRVRGGDRLAAR